MKKRNRNASQCTAFICTWVYLTAFGSTKFCTFSCTLLTNDFKMTKYSFILLFSVHLCILVCLSTAQHHGPWRHKVRWETNGQVYSLQSSGSQYQAPVSGKLNARFLLTRHVPTISSRIFMGRFANAKIHTVGHVVHSFGPNMISGYASHIRNNKKLPLHAKRTGLSSDKALRPMPKQYGTAPTGTTTLEASRSSRASGRHNLVTSKPVPKRTSPIAATGKPPTINSEENPLPQPQLSTLTGSKTANKSKLSTRTNSPAPSASVNNRNIVIHPPFQADERGGDSMIGDEPTNPQVNSRNSFNYNLLPYGNVNRSPQRETGHGTRYFHNGKTTFEAF